MPRGQRCLPGCTCGKHQGTRFLDPDSPKTCQKCGVTKKLSEFGISKKATATKNLSYRAICRACQIIDSRDWYSSNRDRALRLARRSQVKRTYGITLEEYDELLARQDGSCAICDGGEHALGYSLSVDHDHETGRVRGLLCHRCNMGIGQFRENVNLLKKAIKYLEESE